MDDNALKQARILIVDDEDANVLLLERILQRDGYTNLKGIVDSRDVLPLYLTFQPDLILLDLLMPHLDGFAVMEQLAPQVPAGDYFPILVITADVNPETKRRALAGGAKDFLTKPFDAVEVILRIKNLLHTRFLHVELQHHAETLEEKVRERTRELLESQIETLEHLALAAEYRDDDTHEHTQRVGQTAALTARELGLPESEVELIWRAAPLHDLGKIGIPDTILLKPGKLTAEEFDVMKTHSTIGAKILAGSHSPLLQLAEEIASTHHERWDGNGYPAGIKGESIPIAGRVVAVADVFDALTYDRPYKEAWPVELAVAELERERGRHFDAHVVEAFLRVLERDGLKPAAGRSGLRDRLSGLRR